MRQPTVSAIVLTGLAEVLKSAGVDPAKLLRLARIPRTVLSDPEALIPLDRLAQLLVLAADATGWSDFGLRLARARRLSHLGLVGQLAREEPDVRHALLAIASHLHLRSDVVAYQLVETGPEAAVIARLAVWPSLSSAPVNDLLIGGLFQIMLRLLGRGWRPSRVHLMHSAHAQRRLYVQHFGCPVSFDEEADAIIFPASDLQRELPEADPLIRSDVLRQLDERASLRDRGLEAQVLEVLKFLLPTGRCSMERVALRLGVPCRTLRRHLEAEGSTFSGLLNTTRRDLATRYVTQSQRPLAQVSQLLGFSELSAFSRWFSREFHCSASAMRLQHLR